MCGGYYICGIRAIDKAATIDFSYRSNAFLRNWAEAFAYKLPYLLIYLIDGQPRARRTSLRSSKPRNATSLRPPRRKMSAPGQRSTTFNLLVNLG